MFPYKLILHVCLLMMTLFEVILVVQPETTFQASIFKFFLKIFMTPGFDGDPPRIGESIRLSTVGETSDLVSQVVESYYNCDSYDNLQKFDPLEDDQHNVLPIIMFVIPSNPDSD